MSQREKKLIFILFGAAFFIVNIFLFTSYTEAKQKKQVQLKTSTQELALKKQQILDFSDRMDESDWLNKYEPKAGTHADIRADLVNFVERGARNAGVSPKKRPMPLAQDPDEGGRYGTARVEMIVSGEDAKLYRFLTELQNPEQSRSITFLRIKPQRDDPTRVDCELILTQWFSFASDELPEEGTDY